MKNKFFNHVVKTKTCWLWVGANSNGYGKVNVGDGKIRWAHRVSYEMEKGKIPFGKHIDHLCKNKICINPKHLEAVTQTENNRRSTGFGGLNFRKTHCPKKHKYTKENTYSYGTGRQCKICKKMNYLKRIRKK